MEPAMSVTEIVPTAGNRLVNSVMMLLLNASCAWASRLSRSPRKDTTANGTAPMIVGDADGAFDGKTVVVSVVVAVIDTVLSTVGMSCETAS